MKQHIAKVAAACFYHTRRLRQIRRRVGQAVTTRLVLAMITSRLDYCNSVVYMNRRRNSHIGGSRLPY